MQDLAVECDDGVALHVGVVGDGPGVLLISGGPGCVSYLEDDALAPRGMRSWFAEPRGVGRSGGGPHDLAQAVRDLESLRRAAGVADWVVVGHSFGSDLAVRYALDRSWSATSERPIPTCGRMS
ncbi:alpha/beta hydrolase [Allobranchiibius sp. GilTou38]|uniref:alpha/beta fold hydrolase n=1 Tax=Allobranchiibius sp. GilTou38 TaxID=2815210 RepID=UPI001AA0BAF1|nr:alpha/beta hydrolase [Allobranchiibius sp. GilTou38]MBO1765588.1 alpha/beta hydrolase [Allobranchiibius sp. GilTou38]